MSLGMNVARLAVACVMGLAGCAATKDDVAKTPAEALPIVAQAAATPSAPQGAVAPKVAAGEEALSRGVQAYKAGKYPAAEKELKAAVQAGLRTPLDLAIAYKHLAFVYCTSKRDAQCLSAFKAAKAADPAFSLSKAEAGHPMWAKTYKKALGLP